MTEVKVECYAGYRGDEEPRILIFQGRRLMVQEIVSRWRGTAGRYFRVRASDGREYELLHQEATDLWTEVGRT